MARHNETGQWGEDLACEKLITEGYAINQRNFRIGHYELDIIAMKGNRIVFVEVKTRKTDTFGSPMEAITKTKYENIKKGALNYLLEHPSKDYRIDVIGITLKPELKIEHLQNV